eukprot:scaffold1220_cov259-Pinguiococcus_pyrenoidosus.AAC.3
MSLLPLRSPTTTMSFVSDDLGARLPAARTCGNCPREREPCRRCKAERFGVVSTSPPIGFCGRDCESLPRFSASMPASAAWADAWASGCKTEPFSNLPREGPCCEAVGAASPCLQSDVCFAAACDCRPLCSLEGACNSSRASVAALVTFSFILCEAFSSLCWATDPADLGRRSCGWSGRWEEELVCLVALARTSASFRLIFVRRGRSQATHTGSWAMRPIRVAFGMST